MQQGRISRISLELTCTRGIATACDTSVLLRSASALHDSHNCELKAAFPGLGS